MLAGNAVVGELRTPEIFEGDCLEVMAGFEDCSVDAVVTDPPYGLSFMGKGWDTFGGPLGVGHGLQRAGGREAGGAMKAGDSYDRSLKGQRGFQAWTEAWAREALRVAKPGAHMLVSGGTRTYHRMTAGIEDAGWEIRDCLVWAYASGFPKSLNLPGGLGTALKPAWEPIVMARKPLRGTVAANVASYGTGALNIDATRIPTTDQDRVDIETRINTPNSHRLIGADLAVANGTDQPKEPFQAGARWPANVILTDPIFDGDTPGVVGGGEAGGNGPASGPTWSGPSGSASRQAMAGMGDKEPQFYGDSGTYSRFFLIPKADRAEREPILPSGIGGIGDGGRPSRPRENLHPTVKPVELMRHLIRLVTPSGGVVLDPFLGSGTTAIAAEMEGFSWIGIEKEPEYVAIARARLLGTQRGLGLLTEAG